MDTKFYLIYTQKQSYSRQSKKEITASETLKGEDILTGHSITNYESEKLAYAFGIKLF